MTTVSRSDSRFTKVWDDGIYEIFQYKNVYPRAFLVGNYHVAQSGREVLEAVFNPTTDLSKTVVVEERIEGLVTNQNLKGEAKITAYSPNRVTIETTSDKPALLFLSDTYFPSWKATVDDTHTKIFRANYAFRTVPVPAGTHLILFKYQPVSFNLGLAGSIVGVLFLMYVVTRGRYS